MSEMTGGELIARMLENEGVDTMFGIVDGTYLQLCVHAVKRGVESDGVRDSDISDAASNTQFSGATVEQTNGARIEEGSGACTRTPCRRASRFSPAAVSRCRRMEPDTTRSKPPMLRRCSPSQRAC